MVECNKQVRRQERGGIAIMAAVILPLLLIVAAMAVDLGHLAYMKRHLQKVADLAAVAAAQGLANAPQQADAVAKANGFDAGTGSKQMQVTVGYWNPDTVQGGCPAWKQNCSTPTHFSAYVPYGSQANAAEVQVSENVPFFFVFGNRTVTTGAIGWNTNAAGFSISSQLLGLDSQKSALLNAILGGLLNTTLNLGVAGWNGLLGATVNLGQLMQALHVGTVNELLSANLDLPGLYQGMLTVLSNQGGVVNSQATGALGQLLGSGISGNLKVNLGQILQLGLPDKAAAVNANVNVFNLVTAAAMVANGRHFIEIPNLGLNLPGILSVNLGLNVISPPSIAFGQPGQNPDGTWKTQAHTAQVALGLDVSVLSGLIPGGLIHLPIYLEVDPAQGHLTSLQCASPQTGNQVSVGANTGLLTAIVGDIPKDALNNTTQPLTASVKPATLVNALGLATITMKPLILPISAQGFAPIPGYVQYSPLNFTGLPDQSQTITTNAAGSAVDTLLQALAAQLKQPNSLNVNLLGINLGLGQLVGDLLQALMPALQPLGQLLDGVLVPVLQLLGIQLASATVTYNAVNCNAAMLVY